MANQFGEQVSDDVAYGQAREALGHIDDLSTIKNLADTPVKQKALADEQQARTGQSNS
ncbi:hypothetical protein [Amycolatopsis sp. NPDC004378]